VRVFALNCVIFGGLLERHEKWGLGIGLSGFDSSEVPFLIENTPRLGEIRNSHAGQ